MKVVFFGTPEFAIPCLEALYKHHELLAVVTATDKEAGRGHQLIESAVKKWSVKNSIECLQPKSLKSKKFILVLNKLNADLFVVVAFRMLPEAIWNMPKFGTINIHGSLLPDYRGAAPIQRAIIAGETLSGLTCFKLQHEIDTGDIIAKKEIEILKDDTGGTVHDKLSQASGDLLLVSIKKLIDKDFTPITQHNHSTKLAPKIHAEDLIIDWNKSSQEVYNMIRALSPYPCARTNYKNEFYKIYSSELANIDKVGVPGEWAIDFISNKLFIKTQDAWLNIKEIQAPSKRKMNVNDFINGLKNK